MTAAIRIEGVSKLYRLGTVGTGTITHDVNRWWHQIRGKEDPYAKIGQVNDRTQTSTSSTRHQAPGTNDQAPCTKNNSAPDYVWALRDINLEVQQGEILGIIGRNGAGKSTLLKLLSRVTAPTTGSIKTKGRIASLLEVGTGFHPDLTGRENVYMNGALLGMRRHEITRQLENIVEFSGCAKYLDTPVKRYSSGMTVRLGFAVAAHLEPEILVVDEVLAVGDAQFQKKCMGKLDDVARSGRTVLFVSHNMAAIRQLTTRCLLIENGQLGIVADTPSVLFRYQDDFANRLTNPSDIASLKRVSWAGDQCIQFVHAENTTPLIANDQSIQLRIGVKSVVHCKFRVGMTLYSQRGDSVGAGFSEVTESDPSAECQMIEIAIQNPMLAPGNYWFNLGILRGIRDLVDFVDEILQFEVSAAETLPDGLNEWAPAWGQIRLKVDSRLSVNVLA
jgi:lipopolysaccharide transport system ATP-binding protein